METQSAILDLEREWERADGFFGRLRDGVFDPTGLERLVRILLDVRQVTTESGSLDRRLVSLTWYIPLFMNWQRDRVQEQGGSVTDLDAAINRVEGMLEEILGVP